MQALQQWSFPTFGLMKSSTNYDKFACTTQHPAIMPPPPQASVSLKRGAPDRDSMDSSPVKRFKISEPAEAQSLRSNQQQPAPPIQPTPSQAPARNAQCAPNAPGNAPPTPTTPVVQKPEDPNSGDRQPHDSGKIDSSKLDLARTKIEAQFNLEILLKHNELRLIEQELAKAQVCLEQIRRCRVIPFPGQQGAAAQVDNISDGTGAALEPQPGMSRPSHASPWGVTDGPYTQHYARWLIPDPAFDAGPAVRPRNSTGGKSLDGRGLRAVVGDALAGRRRQRPSVDVGAPLSPSVAAPPRIPGGPLLLTRADGVRVKLVCRHCSKEDINSVQGFLNHCRIAHGDSMKTHAEAAATHGVPLEDGEMQAPTPTAGEQSPATPSVTTPAHYAFQRVNVHPLNVAGRTLPVPPATPARPSPLSSSFSASSGYFPVVAGAAATASPAPPAKLSSFKSRSKPAVNAKGPDPNFVASAQTPSLSALAQKRGIGFDLAKLVTSAKQRVDLDKIESLVPDGDAEESQTCAKSQPMARQPSGHSRAPADSQLAGVRAPIQVPGRLALDTMQHDSVIPDSASSSFHPMVPSSSPHTETGPESLSPRSAAHTAGTSETNPGMMTDREDDPEEDDYEEIADSEDDRNGNTAHNMQPPRNVRIHGDDFPMTDVASDAGEDKLSQAQGGSIPAQQKSGLIEKKRGRPRKQK